MDSPEWDGWWRCHLAWITIPAAAVLFSLAAPAAGGTFVVDSFQDSPDASPGDTFCVSDLGGCTLRAAIQEANASTGLDTIEIPAGYFKMTIPGRSGGSADQGDFDIKEHLVLSGAGAGNTIIDGNGLDGVLDIGRPVSDTTTLTVIISDLSITGGAATASRTSGGGVWVDGTSSVFIVRCRVYGNIAEKGGGVGSRSALQVSMSDSEIFDNQALGDEGVFAYGGGVNASGALLIERSLIEGNLSADDRGGGISASSGLLTIRNSTISGNKGNGLETSNAVLENVTVYGNTGNGIKFNSYSPTETLSMRNTIVANNGGGQCSWPPSEPTDNSGYGNLSSDDKCDLDDTLGDLLNTDPMLGALAWHGDYVRAHHPLPGSPVIDGGHGGTCRSEDVRRASRPLDGDGLSGAACDIGALEVLPCIEVEDRVVSGFDIDWDEDFVGCNSVTGGPDLDVIASHTTFRARNRIVLRNGFSVASMAEFSAVLDPTAGSGMTLP